MKKILLLMALGATGQLFAQNNWTKIGPPPPAIQIIDAFAGVNYGAHAFADIDNDGDQDVLITGTDPVGNLMTDLYVNDGTGAYVHSNQSFVGAHNAAVAFGDLDGNGSLDLIVSGDYSTTVYLNDGAGLFTMTLSSLQGLSYPAMTLGDIDNDGDLDLFIGGDAGGFASILYFNDGSAHFSLSVQTFPGIYNGSVKFGDVDSDGYLDLVITGQGDPTFHSELYLNDGTGAFNLIPSNFPAVNASDMEFSDVDGDNDIDLLISGYDNSTPVTKLFLNDNSTGNFTESTVSFEQLNATSMDFGDIDNDGDDDLLICGSSWSVGTVTQLYQNDGNGGFTLITGTTLSSVNSGCSTFADIDNDSDLDILITGGGHADLFLNDGTGVFAALPTTPFSGMLAGGVAFADVDTDGDLDFLITGQQLTGPATKLYLNDGTGGYIFDNTNTFPNVANSAVGFADIDGDGDQDLLITGYGVPAGQVTQLFKNDGAGVFTLTASPLPATSSGSIEFHDVDNDNDPDLVLTGMGNGAQLWMNDGAGNFTVSANSFEGVDNSSVSFGDIDGDNDDDLLITGYGNSGRTANLYTNDGAGMFTLIASPFPGVQQGDADFADTDGDGDLDLVMAGEAGPSYYIAQMYTNDGTGTFTFLPGTPFIATITSGLIFSDIDNDLDADLMTIGTNGGNIAQLYENDGTGAFTPVSGTPFEGVYHGMMAFGDIDGDNDDDLVIAGQANSGAIETNLYRNDNCQQSNVIDVHHACTPFTWIDGVEYTTSNNTASMTYTNAAGCDSIVTLNLIMGDYSLTADVNVLPNVTAQCEVTNLVPPTGMFNCSGAAAATTDQVFPITSQDTTIVTWIYTGTNGVEFNQTQLVIIHDTTAPVPNQASLPDYTSACAVTDLNIPTATDNCGGTINGTTTGLPATTPGTTAITWTFTDANGNSSTQTQNVVITPLNTTITFDGTALTVAETSAYYHWFDCNMGEYIDGATSQSYTPTANGSYSVDLITLSGPECNATTDCFTVTGLAVNELSLSNINIYPNPNVGSFTIETSNAVSITISNTAGQLVYTEELQSGKTEIDLKNLENGVYFVNSIHPNGSQTTQKISILK